MSAPQTLTEIAQMQTAVSEDVLAEIFSGYTYADPDTSLVEIFTAETAELFLARVGNAGQLLSVEDTYEQALAKLDAEIARLESTRDTLLREVFRQIAPVEASYRQLQLFFANTEVPGVKTQEPIDLHLLNTDVTKTKKAVDSPTLEAVQKYIRSRNDSFNFRQAICNLVIPGYVEDDVRKGFEDLADTYGMLVIGDVKEHKDFDSLRRGFLANNSYQSLKRQQDRAATDVIMANWVKLRERHWFEPAQPSDSDGLYSPSSMLFAGAMVRSDRTPGAGLAQGPVGMKYGRIKGVEKARFEPLKSETEDMAMNLQLISLIRTADDDLCFIGNRNQADDPLGTVKFFTTYRVFRFIERMIDNYVRQVAGQRLDRKVVDKEVIEPIEEFLESLRKSGAVSEAKVTHDYNTDEYAQGIVDLDIQIKPVGPAETFKIKIATPPKKAAV